MFRIRRIHDNLLQVNQAAITQVEKILEDQFPLLAKSDVEKIPELLRNPVKQGFRSILYVAEDARQRVLGFAGGNVVGIWLEEKNALGTLVIRIITQRNASSLVEAMHVAAYNVTRIDGEGGHGQVMVLFTIVRRKQLPEVIALIRRHNPQAIHTVENVRFASSFGPDMAITKRPPCSSAFLQPPHLTGGTSEACHIVHERAITLLAFYTNQKQSPLRPVPSRFEDNYRVVNVSDTYNP